MTALASAAEDGAMNQLQDAFTGSRAQSHTVAGHRNVGTLRQTKRSLPYRIGRGLMGLLA